MPDSASDPVDPQLLRAWLTGRSISRGLPAPVPDHGGWRVDVGLPTEVARYVFADVTPGLKHLGESIRAPFVSLKLCGPDSLLRSILPARWEIQGGNHLMTFDGDLRAPRAPPPGYDLEVATDGLDRALALCHGDDSGRVIGLGGELAHPSRRNRYPTPGSVTMILGAAGSASSFWRRWPTKTRRY